MYVQRLTHVVHVWSTECTDYVVHYFPAAYSSELCVYRELSYGAPVHIALPFMFAMQVKKWLKNVNLVELW